MKEKAVIRLNAKVNESETTGMQVNQSKDSIEVGAELDITFIATIEYTLWNNKVNLYAACFLSNAIVKEVNKIFSEKVDNVSQIFT